MTALKPATLRLRTDVLREAMTSHGVRSQEQLAQEIGVSRPTVVRAFSGRHAPGDALLAGLRLRLGLSLDDFVEVIPARRSA